MVSLGDNGLVVGVGTILARMTKGGGLALDADRERLLALLSVAARRPMSADILGSLEAAAGHWRRGDRALANFRLIFAGLPQLDDPTDAWRLRLAEALLDDGMSPRALMVELDLDPAVLTRAHYNPDEPRVGSGNGTESGRWWDGNGPSGAVGNSSPRNPNIILAANKTTPGGIPYNNHAEKSMKKRGVSPGQIDEAVRAGPSIDAINKATGGPAVRYVNPTTGQSAVIDSTTGEVVHVGKPSFKYGPLFGGDVPGATFRPAPVPSPAPIVEEPIIVPDIILPP